MLFAELEIDGAFLLGLERKQDHRGFFARAFCEVELAERGLDDHFPQCNLSHNSRRGTLRGMHFEAAPSTESKIVRCTAGSIYDVVLDLRPGSTTTGRWVSVELNRDNGRAIYIPSGCAHGFLTLTDDVDVYYHMGAVFQPGIGRGVRWDDPIFGIDWPFDPLVISERDAAYPDYRTLD